MNQYLYDILIGLKFPKRMAQRMAEINLTKSSGTFSSPTSAITGFHVWASTAEGDDYWREIDRLVQRQGIEAMHNNPDYPEFHEDKENEMTVDLTKPVQTKSGRAVRILCTDAKIGDYTVVALLTQEDGCQSTEFYMADGSYYSSGEDDDYDLVNVPQEVVTFLNVYGGDALNIEHDSLEQANHCASYDRLGILKITRVDGKVTKKEFIG